MSEVNNGYRFERIEKKFWMTKEQYDEISEIIFVNMTEDANGPSTVCNIYYDTPDFALIRNSIERPLFKEKIRVRSYGIPDMETSVFVEVKKKLNGIGYKRRISVPYSEAIKIMKGNPINCSQCQIEKEILDFVRRYNPQPQVYLTYNRDAFFGKENRDFRVTFDSDLRYTLYDEASSLRDDGHFIMGDNSMILMEIKSYSAIPDWLMHEISRLHIYQAPFSKIGTCYLKHIAPQTVGGIIKKV